MLIHGIVIKHDRYHLPQCLYKDSHCRELIGLQVRVFQISGKKSQAAKLSDRLILHLFAIHILVYFTILQEV
ncbi:hypothetical protein BD408DRAFT_411998 [Parasitella parasitica]|nr:hypothetical protein BD408DRAFT_411998 [Parasitella parasitica]